MSVKHQRRIHLILNDIADPALLEKQGQYRSELIRHNHLAAYNLRDLDAIVVANVWDRLRTDWNCAASMSDILGAIKDTEPSLSDIVCHLSGMIDRCIINTVEPIDTDHRKFPLNLLPQEFRLSSNLAYLIMELDPAELIRAELDDHFHGEERLLALIDKAFDLMREYHWEAESKLIQDIDFTYPDYYLESIEPLINLLRFGLDIEVSREIRKAGLNSKETAIVIYLIHRHFNGLGGMESEQLCRLISRNPAEEKEHSQLLKADSRLLTSKIVVEDDDEYTIAEKLFTKKNDMDDILEEFRTSADGYLMLDSDNPTNQALRQIPNPYTLDKLILPARDMDLLKAALKRFRRGSFADLAEWGINPPGADGKSKNKGLTVLFYGEPGTGKTFAAGAIAAELNKNLMGIDATQLRNKWYGDTEKLVRGIFESMTKIVKESSNPPVFLLNEADQIIHKRDANPVGSDNTENAIQNIVLEEMEHFPGILIMTTNLVDNIDGAYFRRFNIKIEFTLPDLECRTRLWKAHLLPTIPGAESIPISALARDFVFTGGQIALVIQNACSEAISREGEDRCLKLQDILKYASLEQPWIGKGKKKPVGFKTVE